ncbi:hypothetical protein Tco_1443041 [Tanacetum coccineum]
MSHESDNNMEYDPSDVEFTEWLALKFFNYKTIDYYTIKALWIYWARGDDEVELTDEESSDLDDEDEVAKIFRIKTNVFDFETPLCRAFKEFNYLLQIDPNVLTKDIDVFKTYEEYKDDWRYEWNKDVPWWPTCSWKDDGYYNRGNLLGAYICGNTLCYQDLECNEGWKRWDDFDNTNRDNEESENEMENEDEERSEVFDDHERTVCYKRRFEMVKYSFRDDEEYVAIKENEYDDLTNTSKEAIHAYQEIFHMVDEGWMDLAQKKSTMLVKYLQYGNLEVLES